MKGLMSRPAAGWARGPDFIQKGLLGMPQKLQVGAGGGLFPHTLPLLDTRVSWRTLVGIVWLEWR